ncbi:glycoside hydrolase family 6 protein [Actinomycetes bacterium KLBMP 9759]
MIPTRHRPGRDPESDPEPVPRRPGAVLVGAVVGAVVVAAVAVFAFGGPAPQQPSGGGEAPFQVKPLPSASGYYVDPASPAAKQRDKWAAEGRTADAERVGQLAEQPIAQWATAKTGEVGAQIADYVAKARAVGQKPLVVAYHIPDRDCALYSAGGSKNAEDYKAWIRELAGALGGHEATVVLEPDAVPHELKGCASAGNTAAERDELLSDAVRVLKAAGPVKVYVDAGNPGFITNVRDLAGALKRSGINDADGFSLNVANYYATDEVIRYGKQLSDALGGAHFIIDTSRNGNGRDGRNTINGGPGWCNPPGRSIGQVPSTDTGEPLVDAFLWIKRVGESDGECNRGEPAAGQWWPEYALGLVPTD